MFILIVSHFSVTLVTECQKLQLTGSNMNKRCGGSGHEWPCGDEGGHASCLSCFVEFKGQRSILVLESFSETYCFGCQSPTWYKYSMYTTQVRQLSINFFLKTETKQAAEIIVEDRFDCTSVRIRNT